MLKIGNLSIDNPIFLAPMAGITDHPFRVLSRRMGAGVVYTEFVSSDGIVRENLKTLDLMRFTSDERPIGIQIFGDDPETVGHSAKILNEKFDPDIIDINYGCPVPKVTKRGAGSGAMKDLCKMEDITQAVVEAVPQKPITVKMRAGWDNDSIIATDAAIRLEKVGVKAITLHPRTTKQQFSGRSNWKYIKDVKDAVSIPIIGNGDVVTADDFMRMKDETGCDAVMIGRGALGNPWIFKSIQAKLIGNNFTHPTLMDRAEMCKIHFDLLREDKHEKLCVNLSKKHFSWYLKGFPGAAEWRSKFVRSENINEIETHLHELLTEYAISYSE
jgi:tRNA-dihydrouridine synthase B|tara:strand:+ start:2910 stop:3896 length:987 start_codon:yes stop_codon:yes gene_type:complete